MELSNRRLFTPTDQIPRTTTILVIDSDIGNLSILSPSLHYFGYQIVTRQTAAEALYLLRGQCSGEFDLLLTDLFLPDSDGFEFLTAVTAENPSLPVVAFSDFADMAVQALQRGACAFYRKPIAAEILRHLWQHAFHRKIQSCRCNHVAPPLLTLPLPELSVAEGNAEEPKQKGKNKMNRARWSPELHEKFVAAVEALAGEGNLRPGKILERMERMGVEGLNRNQISSHLQQYKKMKMKKSEEDEDEKNQSDNNQQVGVFCSEQGMSDPYSSGTVTECSEDEDNAEWVNQLLVTDLQFY